MKNLSGVVETDKAMAREMGSRSAASRMLFWAHFAQEECRLKGCHRLAALAKADAQRWRAIWKMGGPK